MVDPTKKLAVIEYVDEATELRKRIVRLIAQLDGNRDWVSEKSIEKLEALYEACLDFDAELRLDLQNALADSVSLPGDMR